MHNVSIRKEDNRTTIEVDGFPLQGVTAYQLKGSVDEPTELTVTMLVNNLNLGLDESGNNATGNIRKNLDR